MLNDNGSFLITVPFLVVVHPCPTDCTRWTEEGLRYFLVECGFPLEHIQTGSWGNRRAIVSNFEMWKRYIRGYHSLKNEPEFPCMVWALARKAQ